MSRIGRLPITITPTAKVEIGQTQVMVKGPLGELSFSLPRVLGLFLKDDQLSVEVKGDLTNDKKALWGLWRTLLANAVRGVTEGFTKELEMAGLGFTAQKMADGLELKVGFSHPVRFSKPKGIDLEVDKNIIRVKGFDKQLVGEIAAQIRRIKPPEPYKGKGIRYVGEVVRRKAGKATKAVTTAAK